jgi:hypothetical protein
LAVIDEVALVVGLHGRAREGFGRHGVLVFFLGFLVSGKRVVNCTLIKTVCL